ncbi:MAG: hypothetical protein HY332_02190 [Chloroflexi bacterium]|nr:hypothetical protein [Chloroflexota bacterium]
MAPPTSAPTQPAATSAPTQPAPTTVTAIATAEVAPAAAAAGATSAGSATTQVGAQTAIRSWPLLVSLTIHIPSSIAWLGIVLYDAIIVAVPFLTPAQRGGLLARPRWLVLGVIPVILITGVYQTINNPFSTITDFATLEALRSETTYGLALFWKHGFVLLSFAFTFAVTFWIAPRLVAFADAPSSATALSRLPALLAWGNVAASTALLLCVAVMVFQLH